MPFRVTCNTCGTRFALNDDLYERKIKNRIVTIRCRSCSADISVDGSELEEKAATSPSERPLDSDAVPTAKPADLAPAAKPADLTPAVKPADLTPAVKPADLTPAVKPADLTPTVPMQTATEGQTPTLPLDTRTKTAGLWVVCCPDQDDRELTLPEIEAAIAKNEINGDAIVWRDGMAEWLPIHQVPELRALLKKPPLPKPKGRTLLGIGVKPVVPAAGAPPPKPPSDLDSEPLSVEPEPLSESSELLMQRRGSAVALSPGLLSVKQEGARPEPPPRKRMDSIPEALPRPKLDSKPEPPPRKRMDSIPEPPARPRMDSRPDRSPPKPPTPVRAVPKLLLEERPPDSAPDSSGTPNLRSLAAVAPKKTRDESDKPVADAFLWQMGADTAGSELLGAPTIDVAGLSAPPNPEAAEPAAPSEAPPSSKKKKKARTSTAPTRSKPPTSAEAEGATAHTAAPIESKSGEQRKGSALWAVLVVAGILGGGFFLLRGKGTPVPPEPTPPPVEQATPPPAPEPAAPPAPTVPPPTEAPAAPATAAEKVPAPREERSPTELAERKPAVEREPSAREPAAEPKPAEKAGPTTAATTKPEKPAAPAASADKPAEGATAAFDRAAASAALNSAAAQASACRKDGDPTGAASVVVTFAPSGRVTSANVNGPPFAGTATGGCIAAAMRRARVPPFSGEHVTVGKTVPIR